MDYSKAVFLCSSAFCLLLRTETYAILYLIKRIIKTIFINFRLEDFQCVFLVLIILFSCKTQHGKRVSTIKSIKMEKINYWFSLVVFSIIALLGLELLALDVYDYFKRPAIIIQNEPTAEVALIVEDAIESGFSSKIKKPEPIINKPIHSSEAWLLAERIANKDSAAVDFMKETAPTDTMLAKYREEAYAARVRIIKESRFRYYRPQHAWGELVSDTLGLEPYSVLVFSKGIAINAEGRYHFFHKAALERGLKTLPPKTKIVILQGKDGHWYPVVNDDYGRLVPLSYWGEIN